MKYLLWLFVPILLLGQVKTVTQTGVKRSLIRGDATTLTWTVTGDYSADSLLFIAVDNDSNAVLRLTTSGGLTASYSGQRTTITGTIYAATTENFISGGYLYDISSVTDSITLIMGLLTVIADVSNLEDTVLAPVPYYTIPVDSSDQEPGVLIGRNSNNSTDWWSLTTLKDSLGLDTTGSTSASLDSLYAKTSHIVNVMDYVSANDTTSGWEGAIQAAIDELKSDYQYRTDWFYGNPFWETGVVVLPSAYMRINSPILMYSGITLRGQGTSSIIVEGAGFAGEQLITLKGNPYAVDDAKIKDLTLFTTTVRGIGCESTNLLNSIIENITLNTVQGIILDEYTQGCIIKNIYSWGAVDTLLFLYGNFNYVENIDKEGSTGDAAGAYIYLGKGSGVLGAGGNELHNILIEGGTSANKSGMIIRGGSNNIINNYWFESTLNDGYMLRIEGGEYNQITGYIFSTSPTQKVKIDSTQYFMIDMVTVASVAGNDFYDSFEKDEESTVIIKNLEFYGVTDNPFRVDKINSGWIFDRTFNRINYNPGVVGLRPESKLNFMSASNWLINGGFEAGAYQWNYTNAPDTVSSVTSEIDKGLMARFVWNTGVSSQYIYQNITIPSEFIGQVLTLSGYVKVESDTTDSYAYPFISGCGIGESANNRVYTDSGWQFISQTFEPQSAGTLSVGVGFEKATLAYIDNLNLSVGTETILSSEKFGSIELNGNSMTSAPTYPSTGTWKKGDIIWNSDADGVEEHSGWICTVAGSPGTWVEFGRIGDNYRSLPSDSTGLAWGGLWYDADGNIKRKFSDSTFYAMNLNGTDEYASTTTLSGFNVGEDTAFTVMAWIKSPDVSVDDKYDISTRVNTYDFWSISRASSKPYFFIYDNVPNSQRIIIADNVVEDNEWYLFVATIDDTIKLYINGIKQSQQNVTPISGEFKEASVLDFGAWSELGLVHSNATIGETQIINGYALTQSEITDAYNRTYSNEQHFASSYLGGTVVAWYKWAGGDDASFLSDASGSGNNLTGNNVDRAGDQVIINGGYK